MPKRKSSESEETNTMAPEIEKKKNRLMDKIERNDLSQDQLESAPASLAEQADAKEMKMKFSWELLLPQLTIRNSLLEQEASASGHSSTSPAPDAATASSNQSTTDKNPK